MATVSKALEIKLKSCAAAINQLWIEADRPTYHVASGKEFEFINEQLKDNSRILMLEAFRLVSILIDECKLEYSEIYLIKRIQPRFRELVKELTTVSEYRALPLCLFTVDCSDLNGKYQDKIDEQTINLIPINRELVTNIIKKADEFILLQGDNNKIIAYKIVGLAILTGRRMYKEICLQGSFNKHIDNDKLFFYGQAKGSIEKKNKPYTIPILGSNEAIIKAQNEVVNFIKNKKYYADIVREMDNQDFYESSILQSNFNRSITYVIDTELLPLFVPTSQAGYILDFTPKDTRKLYAAITHQNYVDNTGVKIDFTEFVPGILGHSMISKGGQDRRDTRTSRSYKKYYIV